MPHTKARKRTELNAMRTQLAQELGMKPTGIPFKFTRKPETAARARINIRLRESCPGGVREWDLRDEIRDTKDSPTPSAIKIRGRGHLLFLPPGSSKVVRSHELAHAAYGKAAETRGRKLSREINEGLAFSFEMEHATTAQRRKIIGWLEFAAMHGMAAKAHIQGVKLAQEIRALAPRNPRLRAQMRWEVLEQGFKEVDAAIQYLRRKYSKKPNK